MDAGLFFGSSRRLQSPLAEQRLWAQWTGCRLHPGPPWPEGESGLVRSRAGLRLHRPAQPPLAWHPGFVPRRIALASADPLVSAVGQPNGAHILDCTLGLAHDTAVLLSAGARVEGWEAVAALGLFTLEGLHHWRPDLAKRLKLRVCDHRQALIETPAGRFDIIYLDPLFPAVARGPNAQWAPIRSLGLGGRPSPELIAAACARARRAVILKLAPGEIPAALPDHPVEIIASKRVRYARWPGLGR